MHKQSYNRLYLSGDRHIDDIKYQQLMKEDGIDIPDEYLFTPKINDSYLELYPEKAEYIKKRLAIHGLLEEE